MLFTYNKLDDENVRIFESENKDISVRIHVYLFDKINAQIWSQNYFHTVNENWLLDICNVEEKEEPLFRSYVHSAILIWVFVVYKYTIWICIWTFYVPNAFSGIKVVSDNNFCFIVCRVQNASTFV